jgi:hypothetical protein
LRFPQLVNQLPWASLGILLLAHGLFGLILANEDDTPIWLLVVSLILIVLVAEGLASPWSMLRAFFFRWLNSDFRAFITVVIGTLLGVFVLTWIHIFIHELVLIAAGILVRLDLQNYNFNKYQDFAIILITSLAGFGMGFGFEWITGLDAAIRTWLS